MGCSPPGSSVHGDSPGKNAGVGSHFLLQGIFPTQESNLGLLLCRQILYRLSCRGSPCHPFFGLGLDSSGVLSSMFLKRLPRKELEMSSLLWIVPLSPGRLIFHLSSATFPSPGSPFVTSPPRTLQADLGPPLPVLPNTMIHGAQQLSLARCGVPCQQCLALVPVVHGLLEVTGL